MYMESSSILNFMYREISGSKCYGKIRSNEYGKAQVLRETEGSLIFMRNVQRN